MASGHTLLEDAGPEDHEPGSRGFRLWPRREGDSGSARWGRELWIALAQLSMLGVLLFFASRWSTEAAPPASGDKKPVAMPRINAQGAGGSDADALEGGAFRTLGVVEREVDFSSDPSVETLNGNEAARQRSQDAQDPSVKDFKANLARFGLPVMNGAEVKRAIERREGPYLVRELHFDASRGVGSVSRHYRTVFQNQGYRMQETHLGNLDGVGRELVGVKGSERILAKIRVDDTGRAVQVSVRQRISSPDAY